MNFSITPTPTWHRPAVAHRRAWLRLLLLATLWSSVQGLLGWWVVQSTAKPGQTVVEVCTPNGMQWVALDGSTGFSESADPTAPAVPTPMSAPAGAQSPCVWAAAGFSLPAGPSVVWAALPQPVPAHGWAAWRGADVTPDTMDRVLLMAPMRGPPALA